MSVFKLGKLHYHSLYKTGLILIAIGLPLSRFLMSLGGIFLIVSWLLKGSFKSSIKDFWDNKPALCMALIFAIHVIGVIYSYDFSYASKDLKIKLPLLLYPLVISAMPGIGKDFWKKVFYAFTGACLIGSFHSILVYYGVLDVGRRVHSYRDAFVYVSHIRFSLFIGLCVFVLIYYWIRSTNSKYRYFIYFLPAIWFVFYIFLLGISTGVLVLILGSVIFLLYHLFYFKNVYSKIGLVFLLIFIPLTSLLYLRHCINEYYSVDKTNWEKLDKVTVNGRPYLHHKENGKIESGSYIWAYVCEEELRNEWNKISLLAFDSVDKAGQKIRGTVIRYLNSKGDRKDSVGISNLTKWDINNIENGIANINYVLKGGIRKKIDQTIFEFDTYFAGGNPSGNSVTQKLEFWRASFWIIKENFWFGVGTGDIPNAFIDAYNNIDSPLGNKYRLRAHNQFLTMFIAFGLIGFVVFLFLISFPIFRRKNFLNLPYLIFFFVVTISFFTEDTLETQAGVTFYAFFSCFFLLFKENEEKELTTELV